MATQKNGKGSEFHRWQLKWLEAALKAFRKAREGSLPAHPVGTGLSAMVRKASVVSVVVCGGSRSV